jgi:hypothetical protein
MQVLWLQSFAFCSVHWNNSWHFKWETRCQLEPRPARTLGGHYEFGKVDAGSDLQHKGRCEWMRVYKLCYMCGSVLLSAIDSNLAPNRQNEQIRSWAVLSHDSGIIRVPESAHVPFRRPTFLPQTGVHIWLASSGFPWMIALAYMYWEISAATASGRTGASVNCMRKTLL